MVMFAFIVLVLAGTGMLWSEAPGLLTRSLRAVSSNRARP